MNDKRSDSTLPSARPPMPSIAPPTDDIDSEWGAEELPAPAKVPQAVAVPVAQPSSPPAASASPSYPPAPEPPPARASAPAPATATPLVAASNPLRKQTLLGIAPVIPQQRSEPPAPAKPASEPPRPSASSVPPRPSQPTATSTPLMAENPLRKQTLLGMAPVIPPRSEPPAAEVKPSEPPVAAAVPAAPAESEPAKQPDAQPSIAAIEAAQAAAVAAVSSDAPITRDVKSSRPPAPRVEPSVSIGDHDLPELKPRRSRWVYLLAAAAVLGGGVFLLRQMDRAPQPLDESLARPIRAVDDKVAAAAPKAEAPDDTDSEPNPSEPTEPDPLKAKAPTDAPAATPSAAPAAAAAATTPSAAPAAPSAAPVTADAPTGELKNITVASDPPGARMFHRGKEVGTTPFTLEIPAGERRSYELGKPGFVTRKVVIDGSKPEIKLGLRPE